MWLLLAFIAIPLIEIALFIQVGGLIGLWPTLFIVLLTAVVGTYMVKQQGISTLNRLQSSLNQLTDPSEPLASGAMILFAGALLLTPGFFTDALGLALLMPPVRAVIFRELKKRVKVERFQPGGPRGPMHEPRRADPGVIDGEFTEVDPDKRPTHAPSGWTRH
ncbi:FxsA family protein [Mesobacterium pallidum]|uniref:FxsA family protein n=1 Tax=Mesobacterium pallidum TaxID=2872037 RepID=UPI001EE272BE|nr:FxsA family protein [Mesobacterium pallidum]